MPRPRPVGSLQRRSRAALLPCSPPLAGLRCSRRSCGRPPPLDGLPDPHRALSAAGARAARDFALFPWAGFLLGGDASAGRPAERRRTTSEARADLALARRRCGGGAATPVVAADASARRFLDDSPELLLPARRRHDGGLAVAYAWDPVSGARRCSPMQQLGRTSLFIYWIHVEMVYGLSLAAAQGAVVGAVMAGPRPLLPVHAVVLNLQGQGGGPVEGSGLRARGSP